MMYLLIGILILALVVIAGRWISNATLAQQTRTLTTARQVTGVLLLAGAAVLGARNALPLAVPLALLGIWLLSAGPMIGYPVGTGGPRKTSRVVTEHLEVELDLETGEISGTVLKGLFEGRAIEAMQPAELALLWQDVRAHDPASAQIIEAYLDRNFPDWREDVARGEAEMSGPDGRMTEKEARAILGLQPGAGDEDIRRAHRELMLKLHPDRGGSTYLATKVNEAKDVLLGKA